MIGVALGLGAVEDTAVDPYVIVLGVAQDGGVPQAGTKQHPGWADDSFCRHVACIAVVDPASSQRWLIDATPDFPEQLQIFDMAAPAEGKPGLDGIFLTHAHIGHYTGLMFLGHEVMGASGVPVYAMPRMLEFLEGNGPWDQLVRYKNIDLKPLANRSPVQLNNRVRIEPFVVPHRQEYSEVVGYRITGPNRSVLYIPDIDSWQEWDEMGFRIEDEVRAVDVAYLDATFYDNGEIPGRDMSAFPHPFLAHTMKRFAPLPPEERDKVRFIHFNHTNAALRDDSDERKTIERNGFHVAQETERVGL
ncbi:MAG: MBL fold metallo-hydrolase [Candidatus Latescibacterota bacterium]|nr:MAG: MBL fold metallo-hydrolase [Candidatus Latescibacterota bacterium]